MKVTTITSSNFLEMILVSFSFFSFVPILSFFSLEISQYCAISNIINIDQYTFDRKNQLTEAKITQNRYIDTGFPWKFISTLSKKEISQDSSKLKFSGELSNKEISRSVSEVNCLKKRYLRISHESEVLI